MSDIAFGKAVHQATVFLEEVHADLRVLLTTLGGLMEEAGWRTAFRNRVSWDLDNKIIGGCWILQELNLLFVPQECDTNVSDCMIGFCCSIRGPKGTTHDYATLSASIIRFPKAVDALTDVWEKWDSSPPAYEACLETPGPINLTESQFRNSFPLASTVVMVIVPLHELSGADILSARVVKPILAAEAALGAKK